MFSIEELKADARRVGVAIMVISLVQAYLPDGSPDAATALAAIGVMLILLGNLKPRTER